MAGRSGVGVILTILCHLPLRLRSRFLRLHFRLLLLPLIAVVWLEKTPTALSSTWKTNETFMRKKSAFQWLIDTRAKQQSLNLRRL